MILGKPASMSSRQTAKYLALHANDGLTMGDFFCTNIDQDQWWTINFLTAQCIALVRIYNRGSIDYKHHSKIELY